jgi:Cu(I)/Ag(I) efflux system membrane fusion protein
MKKGYVVIIAVLILGAGFLFYFSKIGLVQKDRKEKPPQEAPASQASEHQGHAKESEQAKEQANPVRTETGGEAPTVEIPLEKQQLIGVKTVEVSARPLHKVIRTIGRIEYDERKLATVNTKIEGWIEKLYVDYTGRYVKRGEPLAEIYSPELFATELEFINLVKWARDKGQDTFNDRLGAMLSRDAVAIIDAARQRLRLWDITEEEIRKVEESRMPIRTLTLYSPVSGYVVQKMVVQGMKVMPGEKLFDVADLSTVWVIADIFEYEIPMIRVGQTARISMSYFPGKEFISRIDYIYPFLSGETRTARVRFRIPNPGVALKPQMFTNVEVKMDIGMKIAIPEDAVIDTGTQQVVYVDKGDGYFEPRVVLIGLQGEGMVEVIKGLKAGDKVASSATFLIDSETKLKGVVPLHKH